MKQPFISLEKCNEIVKQYTTPFYLYDEAGIIENAKNLYNTFNWNNGFKEYFAVKATPNPEILRILKQLGCGVDCASFSELMMAKAVGFSGHEIMFSSNVTPKEDYILANQLGAIINLDDITHIEFLKDISFIPETICIRYNPGNEFSSNNKIMSTPSEAKYGMTKEQVFIALKKLKSLGAKTFGIHSFLASNMLDENYYPSLAETLFNLSLEIKKQLDIDIDFVNLSGGIGIPYLPNEQPANISNIANKIKDLYETIIIKNNLKAIKIYTELGRYMLAPYGALITKVLHQKNTYKNYIGVDACAANLMRPAIYGAYHHISVLGKENNPADNIYDITGGLCENNDKFAINRQLPKIEINDLLFIHDAGAHGHAMGYNYNGKLRSAELLLKTDGTIKLIRRAETLQDYFNTLDIDEDFINNL